MHDAEPSRAQIESFLEECLGLNDLSDPPPTLHPSPPPATIEPPSGLRSSGPTPPYYDTTKLDTGFILFGEKYPIKRANRILVGVLNGLKKNNLLLLEELAKSELNKRYDNKYEYLANRLDELLYSEDAEQLENSTWWVRKKNLGIKEIKNFIQEACRVANVEYGSNLIVRWPLERKKRSSSKKKS